MGYIGRKPGGGAGNGCLKGGIRGWLKLGLIM